MWVYTAIKILYLLHSNHTLWLNMATDCVYWKIFAFLIILPTPSWLKKHDDDTGGEWEVWTASIHNVRGKNDD